VKSTLTIYDNDIVYYTGLHSISENLELNLTVPAELTKLQLKLGSLVFESPIKEQKAIFSFIPE
jgi:hypothetical protein